MESERLVADVLDAPFLAQLSSTFENAAIAALAAQAFSERSRRLRGLARRVVPARARPTLRRVVEGVEARLRSTR